MYALALLAQENDSSGGSIFVTLIPFALIGAGMYFVLIRPQRRRLRQQQEMQQKLGVGDEVITTSGIYGFITGEDGDKFWLEIDDDVQIRIAKAAVSARVDTSADAAPVKGALSKDAAPASDDDSDA